jgi:hypothetical protein
VAEPGYKDSLDAGFKVAKFQGFRALQQNAVKNGFAATNVETLKRETLKPRSCSVVK